MINNEILANYSFNNVRSNFIETLILIFHYFTNSQSSKYNIFLIDNINKIIKCEFLIINRLEQKGIIMNEPLFYVIQFPFLDTPKMFRMIYDHLRIHKTVGSK